MKCQILFSGTNKYILICRLLKILSSMINAKQVCETTEKKYIYNTQTNGPQHQKMYLLICASNKDSNQPVHADSLIRVFIVRMN